MCCCPTFEALRKEQDEALAIVKAEQARFLAEGNEYYAHLMGDDALMVLSLARLVHKCEGRR